MFNPASSAPDENGQGPRPAAHLKAVTTFRLRMLAHDFWPVLNRCKVPTLPGWQRARPTEAEIISWNRSAHSSTGMKIDRDLIAIDIDADHAQLVAALMSAIGAKYPELLACGFARRSTGAKRALFCRYEGAPFARAASWKWRCPGDETATLYVEIFGSRGARQFGCAGPHSRDKFGNILTTYRFEGASPADTPRAALPALPKEAIGFICEAFDKLALDAGLERVPLSKADGGKASVVFDLTDAMEFESDSEILKLGELEDAYFYAQHRGSDLRLSSSFLGHGTNTSKCIVGMSKQYACVYVHNFETGVTHLPATCKRPDYTEWARLVAMIDATRANKGALP
jgi:hypothetical protein